MSANSLESPQQKEGRQGGALESLPGIDAGYVQDAGHTGNTAMSANVLTSYKDYGRLVSTPRNRSRRCETALNAAFASPNALSIYSFGHRRTVSTSATHVVFAMVLFLAHRLGMLSALLCHSSQPCAVDARVRIRAVRHAKRRL